MKTILKIKEECLNIVKNNTEVEFDKDSFECLRDIFFEYVEEKYELETLTKEDLERIFKEEKLQEESIWIGKESNRSVEYYVNCNEEGIQVEFKNYKNVEKWFEEDMCDKIENEELVVIYEIIGVNNVFFSIKLDQKNNQYYLCKNEKNIEIREDEVDNIIELNRNEYSTFKTVKKIYNEKVFDFSEEDEDELV